jgi:hypothetical protein
VLQLKETDSLTTQKALIEFKKRHPELKTNERTISNSYMQSSKENYFNYAVNGDYGTGNGISLFCYFSSYFTAYNDCQLISLGSPTLELVGMVLGRQWKTMFCSATQSGSKTADVRFLGILEVNVIFPGGLVGVYRTPCTGGGGHNVVSCATGTGAVNGKY